MLSILNDSLTCTLSTPSVPNFYWGSYDTILINSRYTEVFQNKLHLPIFEQTNVIKIL